MSMSHPKVLDLLLQIRAGRHSRFLADANGDHFSAIMRFLDRVAEFRERESGRSAPDQQ